MVKLKIETARDKKLSIRVTQAEYERLEVAANALGLRGATAFMRVAALREAEMLNASNLETRVSKLEKKRG